MVTLRLSLNAPENITPAFAAGLERSGKPVRQHAIVTFLQLDHVSDLITLVTDLENLTFMAALNHKAFLDQLMQRTFPKCNLSTLIGANQVFTIRLKVRAV